MNGSKNFFYEKYWIGEDGHLSDFNLKWPKLKKFIPSEKEIVVVDFGCGNGKIIQEMKKNNPQAEYVGLDVSGVALELAEATLPDCKFYKIEDGGSLPLENNSVDFIFSSEVVEHIYDTENAMAELYRILKPGGKLLLTAPYHGLIKNILIAIFAFDKHFNPIGSHIRFFSKKSLFDLLKKYGFEIEKYGYYGRFFPIYHSIFVLAKKK